MPPLRFRRTAARRDRTMGGWGAERCRRRRSPKRSGSAIPGWDPSTGCWPSCGGDPDDAARMAVEEAGLDAERFERWYVESVERSDPKPDPDDAVAVGAEGDQERHRRAQTARVRGFRGPTGKRCVLH